MFCYLLKKEAPLHQMKRTSIAVMEMWHRRVRKLYSTTSNRNHTTVAAPKIKPDNSLFLHKTMSATAYINNHTIQTNPEKHKNQTVEFNMRG